MRLLTRLIVFAALGLGVYLLVRPDEEPAQAGDVLGRLHFVEVAREAGLDLVNVSGDPRRWYIPESNGTGAAWLDFEGDGDLDVFIANGQHLDYGEDGSRLQVVRDATSRLYLGDGFLRFIDATTETGAGRTDWINTVAVGDVDDDGDPDLYLGCFGDDVLLRKEGSRFKEATAASGLGNALWATGAAFADANRDGSLDLYVANYCLFDPENPPGGGERNVIDGVEVAWGPEGEPGGRGYNPGAPDVFYLNDGRGVFREWTEQGGFVLEKPLCSYAAVWSDVTGDGWPDLLVANDLQPSNLFVNHEGRFTEEGVARGFALDSEGKPTSAMGLIVEDVDGDGDFDVLRTNFDMEPNSLHLNDGRGYFEEKAASYGLADPSVDRLGWGGAFFDADHDGDLDLVVANGHVYPQAEAIGMHPWNQRTQLFEGAPHLRFGTVWQDATDSAGPGLDGLYSARGVALADADDDGDHDVLIVDIDGPPRLLRNDSPKRGHWIGLKLVGRRSNREAYGARVEIKTAQRTWTREVRPVNGLYSSHDPRILVGLGDVLQIDEVVIRWPSGDVQVEKRLPVDTYHTIQERAER